MTPQKSRAVAPDKTRFFVFAHPKTKYDAGVNRVFGGPQAPDNACEEPDTPERPYEPHPNPPGGATRPAPGVVSLPNVLTTDGLS